MFYTAVWCSTDEENLKRSIPFEQLGESIRRYGSNIPFNIVILQGIERLSSSYLSSLKAHGFGIIDYCKGFELIIERFKSIDAFYSNYERNCFLRWIAFKEIINSNHQMSQFWHLDSDVILHTSLDSLAEDTRGKTFMLQGCPVFVSVSSVSWFDTYEKELVKLNSDISGYSQIAIAEKGLCRSNDNLLANESLYRFPIGSDQDLLEYLVSSKRIIQESAASIYDSKYYYMQNPLSIGRWHSQQVAAEMEFKKEDDFAIIIGKKKIPFIHYQNTFAAHAALYCFMKKLYLPEFLIERILKYRIIEAEFKVSIIYKVMMKFKILSEGFSREATIRELMNKYDYRQKSYLINLLNFLIKA